MRRISKKVREEAALICAVGASNPRMSECYGAVCSALGRPLYDRAADLAYEAWKHVDDVLGHDPSDPGAQRPLYDAEAEALLRTGNGDRRRQSARCARRCSRWVSGLANQLATQGKPPNTPPRPSAGSNTMKG